MADTPATATVEAPPAHPSLLTSADYAALAQSDPHIIGGARWFWWIAGLSLVNTVLLHSGSDTTFIIGLGFTLLADVTFQEWAAVAFAIDAVALGFFFAMGWFAGKGRFWAFVAGIIFYTLDAGIYLYFEYWMPLAFHGFALIFIVRAAVRLRAAVKSVLHPPAA